MFMNVLRQGEYDRIKQAGLKVRVIRIQKEYLRAQLEKEYKIEVNSIGFELEEGGSFLVYYNRGKRFRFEFDRETYDEIENMLFEAELEETLRIANA